MPSGPPIAERDPSSTRVRLRPDVFRYEMARRGLSQQELCRTTDPPTDRGLLIDALKHGRSIRVTTLKRLLVALRQHPPILEVGELAEPGASR